MDHDKSNDSIQSKGTMVESMLLASQIENYKINTSNLHFLCFALGMFAVQIGWVISGNNQTEKIIKAKLGYADDEFLGGQADLGTSIITSSSVCGMCIGSLTSGGIVSKGRR